MTLGLPDDVRGPVIRGLVRSIARERVANDTKAERLRAAFALLALGMAILVIQAATLGVREVW